MTFARTCCGLFQDTLPAVALRDQINVKKIRSVNKRAASRSGF